MDSVSEIPIKKVEDPTLPKGQEKKLESGGKGYTVSTYRVYKDNDGTVLRKEKVYISYYPKKQEIVVVGTMEIPVIEDELTLPIDDISSGDLVNSNNEWFNSQQPITNP